MLLIKYATRGRADHFKKAIWNIHNTISTEDFKIFVTIDEDDRAMMNPEMLDFMNSHEHIVWGAGKSESKIHAINRDMDKTENLKWDLLLVMSDDMFFVQFGWDNIIRQRMKDNFPEGDCFLHFDDGYVKAALATMSIMDRKYYNRDKYIYHPIYKSFSCDAEAYYVALMRGRHKYFDEILFKHQHPSTGKLAYDETYRVNALATDHDTKVYFERLRRYFDEPAGHERLRQCPELKNYL